MWTFSPQYNSITVAVRDVERDSMTTWSVVHREVQVRPLNLVSIFPGIGWVVGAGRTLLGLADVIASLYISAVGDNAQQQGTIGRKNVFRGLIESSPGAIIWLASNTKFLEIMVAPWFPAAWMTYSTAMLVYSIAVCAGLAIYDAIPPACAERVTARATALFDDMYRIELTPSGPLDYYLYDEFGHLYIDYNKWLAQLYKYGTWQDASATCPT